MDAVKDLLDRRNIMLPLSQWSTLFVFCLFIYSIYLPTNFSLALIIREIWKVILLRQNIQL